MNRASKRRKETCREPEFATVGRGRGRSVLWVDDSRPLLELYEAVFEGLGFAVEAVCSGREAIDYLSSHSPHAVILDYEMPEMDGGMLASLIKDRYPELPVILYSGSVQIPQKTRDCVDGVCSKTAPREELLRTIDEAIAQHAALRKLFAVQAARRHEAASFSR
jgi:CheY-like chemotaxis protein